MTSAPEIQILTGGEVLAQGRAVLWAAVALDRQVQAHRDNGYVDPALAATAKAYAVAARRVQSFSRETKQLSAADVPADSSMSDPITAEEAAGLLGTTVQNVTSLCRRGSLETRQRRHGRWLVERSEVLDRVQRKAS